MNQPARYRKRPVEIEAMQWDGTNEDAIAAWVGPAPYDPYPGFHHFNPGGAMLYVTANRAWLGVDETEWVAKDSQGFYPIKDVVFQQSYEAVA